MTQLSSTAFLTKYNDAGSGLFKNNTARNIGADDLRTLVTDLIDSLVKVDSYSDGAALTLVSGVTYNLDMASKRTGQEFIQITGNIIIEDCDNPVDNSVFFLTVENNSGSTRTVTFQSNSRLMQNGNATGSQNIDPGISTTFVGFVDSSAIIRWHLMGSTVTGTFAVGDLTLNPASAITYDTTATYRSYPQSGAIALTSDFTGAVGGSEKIFQIVGDGANITFDTGFVNKDDGTSAVATVNYTGAVKIYTYYNASLNKICVSIPILGVGGGSSALNDLSDVNTTTAVNTNTSKTLRVLGDHNTDGTYDRQDWTPGPQEFPINTAKTTGYSLVAGDLGQRIRCNGTFTVTLPNSLNTGFWCIIENIGAGTITLSATTTLNSVGTLLEDQYTACEVLHVGSNVWEAKGGPLT